MTEPKIIDATVRDEPKLKELNEQEYVLRLYVTGATPASTRAIQNLRTLCDEHLQGRFQLEVIDIFQRPKLAEGDRIIAAPTLVRQLPLPVRKFIGDLSNLEGKLLGLDLRPKGNIPEPKPAE